MSYISAPSIPAPWNTKTKGTDVLALSDWGRYAMYVLVVPSTIRLRVVLPRMPVRVPQLPPLAPLDAGPASPFDSPAPLPPHCNAKTKTKTKQRTTGRRTLIGLLETRASISSW